MLGRRGFALESAAARVCREAGAKVSTNVMLRDLDLLPQDCPDKSRLEVVADGLPLHHGGRGFFGDCKETEGETIPRAVGPV